MNAFILLHNDNYKAMVGPPFSGKAFSKSIHDRLCQSGHVQMPAIITS